MYINFTEIYRSDIVGKNFRITEYYPIIQSNRFTVPVEGNSIHPCFTDMYNRNQRLIQTGTLVPASGKIGASISLEEYKESLTKLLNHVSISIPDINIQVDNIERMYSMWIQAGLTYCISGMFNITTHAGELDMTKVKEFWIPEFDIGIKIGKQQFLNAVKRFVPEFSSSILACDALYKFATDFIMEDNSSLIFNAQYSTQEMTNFITGLLPNINAEKLFNVINSRLDVNQLYEYYDYMSKLSYAPAVAKALLYYHNSIIQATTKKVRASFGLPETPVNMVLTLPLDAYLNVNASKDNAIVSIM